MMKPFIISLIALCCFIDVQAQKVTRNYDNVTMSEALRDLNELSPDYTISFMYNELEDFRVTTSIKHKSVTDAIMQVIGFYPVRAVKRGEHELYVECTHKTDRHLTGHHRREPPARALRQCLPASSIRLNRHRWRREQRGWCFCHPIRAAYRSCPYLIRRLQDCLQTLRPARSGNNKDAAR